MKDYLLSISIVIYRLNLTVLEKALEHLSAATKMLNGNVKLFFVDNNSSRENSAALKALAKKFALLHPSIIQNPKNLGYGIANNQAINQTQAKYHLVLNPDAYLDQQALIEAVQYMETHLNVGLLCPAVFGEDGQRHYVHRLDPTLWDLFLRGAAPVFLKKIFQKRIDAFELRHINWEIEQDILSPSGCCLFFRTSILKKISGFDPDYFLYYEDSDIGRRIRQHAKIKYLPSFKVTHVWAREGHKSLKMKWHLIKSGLIYFSKWRGLF
jgi:GT2 family glycosyltransferase